MHPEELDTKEGRDAFVRQAIRDKPSLGKKGFKKLVKRSFPYRRHGDLASKLMNAYCKVSTEEVLDTEEGLETFVRRNLKKHNFTIDQFETFVNEKYTGQVDLVSRIMKTHHQVARHWAPRQTCRSQWKWKMTAAKNEDARATEYEDAGILWMI